MTLTVYDELEQGTPEWLQARAGIVTASVIGRLITPSTLKVASNDTSRGLLLTLAGERLSGHVDETYTTWEMQRGHDDEPFARAMYAEHFTDEPVTEVGFLRMDTARYSLGFSPDGLVGADGLIECKSRDAKVHMQTIRAGRPPAENMAQLQCGLYVSGRAWIDYVSFAQGWPLWVKRVFPDYAWFRAIQAAVVEAEAAITEITDTWPALVAGFPVAERRPDFEEIVI